uniref:Glutathione peroxidase n=1 Tax=Bos indicus x Bos taurus TaxID=30522 RepID=A0A4W2CA50_BOBOX|nr:PREDICTED: probable glutathione peroxidase 8 isoform X2 [Bos indicus]
MEPLTAYPLRCSGPKAKAFAVLLSMVLCTVMLFLLQLKFLKPKINSFYTFEVKDANGRVVSLEKFKGKVALVVNVASDCQLTDRNYLALQELHKEFGPFHFSVLAFPCNQFGESEPRPSKEVVSFARNNFGVTFPIFHKIKILGSEAEPAFRFLVGSFIPSTLTSTDPQDSATSTWALLTLSPFPGFFKEGTKVELLEVSGQP